MRRNRRAIRAAPVTANPLDIYGAWIAETPDTWPDDARDWPAAMSRSSSLTVMLPPPDPSPTSLAGRPTRSGDRCRVSIGRPQSLRALSVEQMFGIGDGDDAGSWSRLDQVHRETSCVRDRGQSTVRLDDVERL